jgi:hypothetical protein
MGGAGTAPPPFLNAVLDGAGGQLQAQADLTQG